MKQPWLIAEIIFLPAFLAYFLLYPRDTVSDFMVCSTLSFSILFVSAKIHLPKPEAQALQTLDYVLAIFSIFIFLAAWVYAWQLNKITYAKATESLLVTLLYFYYAWFQHFLAQRYTAVRFKQFIEWKNPLPAFSVELRAALLTGFVFGLLHIPYPDLMLPAALGGAMYAYYFLRTGRLWAVVVSHGLIASSWIYWALDSNAFEEFTFIFPQYSQ